MSISCSLYREAHRLCLQSISLQASWICVRLFSKLWYKYFDRISQCLCSLRFVTLCTLLTNLFIVGLNAVNPTILIGCFTTQLQQLPVWWMGQRPTLEIILVRPPAKLFESNEKRVTERDIRIYKLPPQRKLLLCCCFCFSCCCCFNYTV